MPRPKLSEEERMARRRETRAKSYRRRKNPSNSEPSQPRSSRSTLHPQERILDFITLPVSAPAPVKELDSVLPRSRPPTPPETDLHSQTQWSYDRFEAMHEPGPYPQLSLQSPPREAGALPTFRIPLRSSRPRNASDPAHGDRYAGFALYPARPVPHSPRPGEKPPGPDDDDPIDDPLTAAPGAPDSASILDVDDALSDGVREAHTPDTNEEEAFSTASPGEQVTFFDTRFQPSPLASPSPPPPNSTPRTPQRPFAQPDPPLPLTPSPALPSRSPLSSTATTSRSSVVSDTTNVRFDDMCQLIADYLYSPLTRVWPDQDLGVRTHPEAPEPLSMDEFLNDDRLHVPDVVSDTQLQHGDALNEPQHDWRFRHLLFSGFLPEDSIHSRITLRDQPPPSSSSSNEPCRETTYDVDSIIAKLSSLGSLRSGLKILTIQTPVPHITSSLHLGTFPTYPPDQFTVNGESKILARPIHEIPQIVLGRLADCDDFEIIVLLPAAVREGQQTSRLPDEVYDIWLDAVFLPALYEVLPTPFTVSLPATAAEARQKATLKYEQTRISQNGHRARQQLLAYYIAPQYLGEIWARVLENIDDGHHALFKDLWILVNAKGIKSFYRDTSWVRMVDKYRRHQKRLFHHSPFDWQWIDIGKQWTPRHSGTHFSRHDGDSEILLWDTSYLEEVCNSIRQIDQRFHHTVKMYAQYFIPRIGTASFESAVTSDLRSCGLAFAQWYNPIKEFWAAGNHHIAEGAHITDLAQDPRIVLAFQRIAQAVQIDFKALISAYQHTKQIVHLVTTGSRYKSSGLREEYRVSDTAFDEINRRMRAWLDAEGPADPDGPCDGAYISVPTPTFLQWTRWNVNRLCYGFEFIYRGVRAEAAVSYEQTRAMTMFLRAIPCFFGLGPSGLYARFWRDRLPAREDHPDRQHGFAMLRAMEYTNFPWFAPKLNFHSLTFEASVAPLLGFKHTDITHRLRRSFAAIGRFRNLAQRKDDAHDWLIRFGGHDTARALIFDFLHQVCACVFRQDVFRYLHDRKGSRYRKQVLVRQHRDQALAGHLALTYDNLRRALKLPTGRRGWHLKSACNDSIVSHRELFERLFSKEKHVRGVKNEPYFILFWQVWEMVRDVLGHEMSHRWYKEFREYLRVTCWVLPIPGNNRFIVVHYKTKDWGFFSQINPDIQALADGQRPADTFVRHVGWQRTYDREKWREHCVGRMRGRPVADTNLIDMNPEEFLEALIALDPEGGGAVDDAADADYNPQYHYDTHSSDESDESDESDDNGDRGQERRGHRANRPGRRVGYAAAMRRARRRVSRSDSSSDSVDSDDDFMMSGALSQEDRQPGGELKLTRS